MRNFISFPLHVPLNMRPFSENPTDVEGPLGACTHRGGYAAERYTCQDL
jgi:hypothetical protein